MLNTGSKYNKQLARAYHNVLRLEETKRKHSRTTTSFRGRNAMEFIYEARPDGCGCRAQSEIADFLKITRPSCTSLINKLEELGYVKRIRNAQDEREIDIYLTRKGRLVTALQCMHRNNAIDKMLSDFTEEERAIIYRGFERLNETLEECADTFEGEVGKHKTGV